jgi:hypothetical protein
MYKEVLVDQFNSQKIAKDTIKQCHFQSNVSQSLDMFCLFLWQEKVSISLHSSHETIN